jgi:EmrB/QacA subfamily drug resistance transporter
MGTNTKANVGSLRSLPRKQVFLTFAGVILAMFLSSLDQTVVGTAMPRIIIDLGGFNQYTWVTTAYIITSAVTVPIVGKLIDMYGRKMFYIAGLAVFILASLACGFSSTMTQIIVFRAVQGIGAGIMMANAFTTIADLFSPAERGKYQGYMGGVFGLSSVIGPTVGGFLTDSLSWHWVFFINVPFGILIIALFIKYFPNLKPDNARHSIDYPGVSLLILTVVPALLALSWGGSEYPWGSLEIIGIFIFAVVMLGLFLFFESRAKEPIIPLSLFKNRIVTVSVIVTFLTSIGMFGGIVFVPLFFQGVLGASATRSGNFLIPMTLGIVFGSFVSGQLLSRTGGHYRIQGVIGAAVMCTGLFLLSRIDVNTSYGTVVINTVITGLGLGTSFPLYTIAVQNAVPNNMLGVATSVTTFFRSIGGSVGLAILGSVMNNRFASELLSRIPESTKASVPPEMLASLTNNPQALVSTEAQAQLQSSLSQLGPQGAGLLEQLLSGLRQALAASIAQAFLISMIIVLIALIAAFFMKEVPLRRHNRGPEPALEKKL